MITENGQKKINFLKPERNAEKLERNFENLVKICQKITLPQTKRFPTISTKTVKLNYQATAPTNLNIINKVNIIIKFHLKHLLQFNFKNNQN